MLIEDEVPQLELGKGSCYFLSYAIPRLIVFFASFSQKEKRKEPPVLDLVPLLLFSCLGLVKAESADSENRTRSKHSTVDGKTLPERQPQTKDGQAPVPRVRVFPIMSLLRSELN